MCKFLLQTCNLCLQRLYICISLTSMQSNGILYLLLHDYFLYFGFSHKVTNPSLNCTLTYRNNFRNSLLSHSFLGVETDYIIIILRAFCTVILKHTC